MTSKYVTYKQLAAKRPCSHYLNLFAALFGKTGKVKVTRESMEAVAHAFDWDWAYSNLLTQKQQPVYDKLKDEQLTDARSRRDRTAATISGLKNVSYFDMEQLRHGMRARFSRDYYRIQSEAFAFAYNSPRK